jgi:hypothetical protein
VNQTRPTNLEAAQAAVALAFVEVLRTYESDADPLEATDRRSTETRALAIPMSRALNESASQLGLALDAEAC